LCSCRISAAFTYLASGETKTAGDYYRQVDRSAPRGFFTGKVAVDSLRREREGMVSPGTDLAFVMLEWEADVEKKSSVFMSILKANSEFPAAWQLLAIYDGK
jgi:hypothetical protein